MSCEDDLEEAKALLKECADDIISWVDAEYPSNSLHYPNQKRRFKRDMELPERVYKFLGIEDDGK